MLFTPGPTEIEPELRAIAAQPLPYFRATEYSEMILDLTNDFKMIFQTKQKPLILTSSGSGVMEMAIQNLTNEGDKVVVLNCGAFGQKWVDMCQAFALNVIEYKVPLGKLPDLNYLDKLITSDVTALFITAHETSTGLLNKVEDISEITMRKDILYIVDGVSSIAADEFYLDKWNCDCAMVSSQKALACSPGISSIVFSEKAWEIIPIIKRHRYYFDAVEYDKNAVRGMLPYTPAMNVTYMLLERFKRIRTIGLDQYILLQHEKAKAFREAINFDGEFPLYSQNHTNALSAVCLPNGAETLDVIKYIKETYNDYLAPNPTGKNNYLRVSHMGNITSNDMLQLAEKIKEACLHVSKKN